jgi:hypothetical protein
MLDLFSACRVLDRCPCSLKVPWTLPLERLQQQTGLPDRRFPGRARTVQLYGFTPGEISCYVKSTVKPRQSTKRPRGVL